MVAGFGFRSLAAPVCASTDEPINPPRSMLPAIYMEPSEEGIDLISTVFVRHPGFEIVRVAPVFLGKARPQGVDVQLKPRSVSTCAPDGVVLIMTVSFAPRVTVAQPTKSSEATASMNKFFICFSLIKLGPVDIWDSHMV